ncbi:MAG TPA: FtsX-like permease family protein [Vicinamibacterales bacterium]|nr:FtsX-like permease family protein [Vicinamibacterales bacterium]
MAESRRREIGIRMVLGATPRAAIRLLVKAACSPVGWGLGLGVVGGAWLSRLTAPFLLGVDPVNPCVYGVTVALFLGVAVVSSAGAARRVRRISLSDALRD